MKKTLFMACLIALSMQAFAVGFSMKENMQQMKMAFKYAAEAQTVPQMQEAVQEFRVLIKDAYDSDITPEKAEVYREGFIKLNQELDNIEADLEQGQLEAAQKRLQTIDQLRETYHDKRNVSFWKRLFG